MLPSVSAAELRAEQPVCYEYRDQMFYVEVPALGFPIAVPPETFLRNFEAAAKAIVAYHAAISAAPVECEILPFRKAS